MRKYLEPNIEIRELLFEDVVTTSGVPTTLTLSQDVGSLEGNESEALGDALFFN